MRRIAIACCVLSVLAVSASPSGAGTGAAALRLGGIPLQLLSTPDRLWLLLCDRGCSGQARHSLGRVVEIDPRAGRVLASAKLNRPGAIAVGQAGVYATDFWRDAVRRLDPHTLRITATLHLTLPFFIVTSTTRDNAFLPEQVAVGGGAVWLSESLLGLYRIDTKTNRVVAPIPLGPAGGRFDAAQLVPARTRLLALGEWTNAGTLTNRNGLARVDPARNRIEAV